MKYLAGIFTMLLIFACGFFLSRWLQLRQAEKESIKSEVILTRIKEVAKLVTVEGYFSELYNYKNFYNYDWSIFTKKALIRVKARVSMGVDMNKVKMTFDNEARTLTISKLPTPEIISIEHDLDYYDITEGTFNSFSPEDFNKINKDAKDYIQKIALKSDLPAKADLQSHKALETIKLVAESAGWKVNEELTLLKN